MFIMCTVFSALNKSYAPSIYPSAFISPQALETTDLLTVTTVFVGFSLAGYPIVGPIVIYTAFSV